MSKQDELRILSSVLLEEGQNRYSQKDNGVWSASNNDLAIYEELDEHVINLLISRSLDVGWRKAASEILGRNPRLSAEYLLNEIRGDILYASPISCTGRVALDVGCGMGGILPELARRYERVIGLELSPARARFSKMRLEQDGFHNVCILNDDFKRLKFKLGSLDLVFVNGVLEWIPCSAPITEHPQKAQLSFLKQIFEALRKDGMMYVGIENRFGYDFLRGAPDPHSGIPYNSIVPRFLANILLKKKLKRNKSENRFLRMAHQNYYYRTITYSLLGYKSLFRQAGFSKISVRIPCPDYNIPNEVYDTSNASLKAYARKRVSLSKFYKLCLLFPALATHTAHSFAFFCRKSKS